MPVSLHYVYGCVQNELNFNVTIHNPNSDEPIDTGI